jgi:hypothetical protein
MAPFRSSRQASAFASRARCTRLGFGVTIDQTGELIDQEYHGRFDVLAAEIQETICSILGP